MQFEKAQSVTFAWQCWKPLHVSKLCYFINWNKYMHVHIQPFFIKRTHTSLLATICFLSCLHHPLASSSPHWTPQLCALHHFPEASYLSVCFHPLCIMLRSVYSHLLLCRCLYSRILFSIAIMWKLEKKCNAPPIMSLTSEGHHFPSLQVWLKTWDEEE